jgi:superfamily II DNA or RNA helicase
LILIPNAKLYETWESEIKNHTENFDCVLYDKKLKNEIKRNTIVISTLGRMRDHPIANNWIYVVIDECLSVQNKEALHTEEALRQIMSSQYGVLLLSATFFRSRFDKLYYMLKMLRTGLPLDIRYLDTILSETIVCNTFDTGRTWYVTEHKLYLSDAMQKKYDTVIETNKKKTDEEKYSMLVKFITDNCNYIDYFNQTIKKLEKERKDSKILIFTKSKEEAEKLAESNPNIGLYPDINKKHVCGSINAISHGINNLVGFDTILMRPCNFDVLPQCKGRLDRPGQKNKNLYLEYIYLDKTIEIAGMYKIALGNNFYDNYVLPLAEFYKIAIEGKI